ncbi:DUF115 domain-containing protein, partial [Campylobacter jejuni]|nr:DUF115 domain-containing protein [Campylobacter jejuni]
DIVSKCFDNDFKEFDKGILFILASVVHKEVIEFLERNNREYMLVHRNLLSAFALNQNNFGYLDCGASVANVCYGLAAALRHENIIMIGQDLAYAEDGSSHPNDHIYGKQGEKLRGEVYTLAYGGEKQVRTQITWNLFRKSFERAIFFTKEKLNIFTYNCTEGGVRIEGTIEKPFKETCEKLLDEKLSKPFELPLKLAQSNIQKELKKTQYILNKNILESKKFIKKCEDVLIELDCELNKNEINMLKLQKNKLNLLKLFNDFCKLKLFNELTQAIYYHNECEIVRFEVLNTLKQNKNIKVFLKNQIKWWIQALKYLKIQNDCIQKALEKWQI